MHQPAALFVLAEVLDPTVTPYGSSLSQTRVMSFSRMISAARNGMRAVGDQVLGEQRRPLRAGARRSARPAARGCHRLRWRTGSSSANRMPAEPMQRGSRCALSGTLVGLVEHQKRSDELVLESSSVRGHPRSESSPRRRARDVRSPRLPGGAAAPSAGVSRASRAERARRVDESLAYRRRDSACREHGDASSAASGDDADLLADQRIQQRRLADVRAADDRDKAAAARGRVNLVHRSVPTASSRPLLARRGDGSILDRWYVHLSLRPCS